MWLASVAWRAARSTRATHRSPCLQRRPPRPRRRPPGRRRAGTTSSTRARQSPSSHSIVPASAIWPPPVGVERRLGELEPACGRRSRSTARDGRALLDRLVAGERASEPAARANSRTRSRPLAGPSSRAAARARARAARSISALEARRRRRRGPRSAASSRVRSIREAEGVVQPEGVLGADPSTAAPARALDQLVEQLRALLERAAEALLLGGAATCGSRRARSTSSG